MKLPQDFMPEFGSLTGLLLDMAQEQTVEKIINMVVDRLSQRPAESLVEIWLKMPGDVCVSCCFKKTCKTKTNHCLHRVAWTNKYENAIPKTARRNTAKDVTAKRIPEGFGVIGEIGSMGRQAVLKDITNYKNLLPLPVWSDKAGIISFMGQPLIHHAKTIGVIAMYLKMKPIKQGIEWGRVIANHAAMAIANARAIEHIEALREQISLEQKSIREEVIEGSAFGGIIGQSNKLYQVLKEICQVAPTDATALIQGESGTGKELVAREIHKRSHRNHKPMFKVNCASVPRELWESEFFGHKKGAFTGALQNRSGHFQAANGGTLFLDEVGEIPLELQGKLLQILQDRTYNRVGDEITRKVDVRIIAATNKNLNELVAGHRFRADLFYRLSVFPIKVPPLRLRKEDIPLLANHFLTQSCKELDRSLHHLSTNYIALLQEYDWPGNVRELQNVIQRAVITDQFETVIFNTQLIPSELDNSFSFSNIETIPKVIPEAEMEKRIIENIRTALMQSNGKIYGPGGASKLLGIKPTTLSARIKKYGLQ
jgi:transcriptional regulator with GAF, ATPase, and Fis domain